MRDRSGRKNVYKCDACGGWIVTIDRDAGTTPAFLACRSTEDCDGRMASMWYDVPQELEPTHEWYNPLDHEYRTLNKLERDHVDRGGLLIREVA